MKRVLFAAIVCCAMSVAVAQTGATGAPGAEQSGPKAIIHTSLGDIHCTLFPDKAPIGVQNFIGLATGKKDWTDPNTGEKKHGVPLYDNTQFHRVIPDFMIQGGDPLSRSTGSKRPVGTGDPGYKFKNETSPDLRFDRPGRLAYANAGPNTNGSQFFVTEVPYPSLNGGYTIFGQCEDSSIVQRIARVPRDPDDRPRMAVTIKHIDIVGAGSPSGAQSSSAASESGTKSASGSSTKSAAKTPAKKPNK